MASQNDRSPLSASKGQCVQLRLWHSAICSALNRNSVVTVTREDSEALLVPERKLHRLHLILHAAAGDIPLVSPHKVVVAEAPCTAEDLSAGWTLLAIRWDLSRAGLTVAKVASSNAACRSTSRRSPTCLATLRCQGGRHWQRWRRRSRRRRESTTRSIGPRCRRRRRMPR